MICGVETPACRDALSTILSHLVLPEVDAYNVCVIQCMGPVCLVPLEDELFWESTTCTFLLEAALVGIYILPCNTGHGIVSMSVSYLRHLCRQLSLSLSFLGPHLTPRCCLQTWTRLDRSRHTAESYNFLWLPFFHFWHPLRAPLSFSRTL